MVELRGQKYPGEQGPLQAAVCKPLASPKRPGGQAVGCAAPAVQKKPRSQGAHTVEPGSAANVPARQGLQTFEAAPAVSEYVPAVQLAQTALELAPVAEEYVPAGQGVQGAVPAAAEKVPAGQSAQAPPAKLVVPAGHAVQFSKAVAPGAPAPRPAGHFAQSVALCKPVTLLKVPAGQGAVVHTLPVGVGETLPIGVPLPVGVGETPPVVALPVGVGESLPVGVPLPVGVGEPLPVVALPVGVGETLPVSVPLPAGVGVGETAPIEVTRRSVKREARIAWFVLPSLTQGQ